ncbi:MAG: DUF6682 family protein [Betaproteobacteria bacterium]
MPTITAQSIVDKAQTILQDTPGMRWSDSELLGWLNDGQREICSLRPSAKTRSATLTLVAGTRQTLPDSATMLIEVMRNMPGGSPGAAIRKTDRETLDSFVPGWHTLSPVATLQNFAYDPSVPEQFWVYPPAVASTQIEAVIAERPTDVALANPIDLDDMYSNALMDYVLYRGYSKDAEHEGNRALAVAYRQSFENTLGLKATGDAAAVKKPSVE